MSNNEKALLVGVNINKEKLFNESMEELANLAVACNLQVISSVTQNLKAPSPSYYVGFGKVQELKAFIEANAIDVVVFNNELSPAQASNLETALQCNIMDRTSLVLEIFSRRAKTREAKLQVEIALLQYVLPRLIGSNANLGRQSGGVGTRNRGGGEKKLELDRRKIRSRISLLEKTLADISKERLTQRKQRKKAGLPVVALVGYTNAGKSTLMNALIDLAETTEHKKVVTQDMLFVTLDTAVRKIALPNQQPFLLADTVGFVGQLPHNLIKAFRSTLEEVKEADLLLHVVDISSSQYQQQIEIANKTLRDIGAGDIPMLYVYNKADLIDFKHPVIEGQEVCISAKQKKGLQKLLQLIQEKMAEEYLSCTMLIPYEQGEIAAYLQQHANILEISYEYTGILLTLECAPQDYTRYQQYILTA